MKIAILGYGVEGKAVEKYFSSEETTVFNDFAPEEVNTLDLKPYDLVFRSPSVHPLKRPLKKHTSITKYFYEHCPCSIIGVTGTKGKGTTCSMITAILEAAGHTVHLVGNIGVPALEVLDSIKPDDFVVYEMSSFQLWDLEKSPHVAVVLRIEPDHLNVHDDYADYVSAKSHIAAYQTPDDFCIYYENNPDSCRIAEKSAGTKYPYPSIISHFMENVKLSVPGNHNRENAAAATIAAAVACGIDPSDISQEFFTTAKSALENFKGLPHRCQYLRTLNDVDYYDDNYSSAFPATDVALAAFSDRPLVLIAGGKDKGVPLGDLKSRIFGAKNLRKAILIGETAEALAKSENPTKYLITETLAQAVATAQEIAENYATPENPAVVLMSPGCASFDMFKNFADRGEQYQQLVKELH
ncbi:UDP-N-acetylmuramoyl-L-alanine--D-glutamate ligase [Candidatus Saccharibacteria bacterium]|nr:UDP-N-acetylmuramoyl-L-alanine--D-glutamate ligase [Candidatus Saccharibacteria bacterium]